LQFPEAEKMRSKSLSKEDAISKKKNKQTNKKKHRETKAKQKRHKAHE